MFKSNLKIGPIQVGDGEPVLVIAEAGVSHFGSMDLAHQLLDLAIEAKADVFKTQFFDVDQMFVDSCIEWKDRLRGRNISLDQAFELKQKCNDNNIIFMATAHDESRISWLKELDVPAVKIGSGERNNIRFIKSLAELGKPVILSTGMYREKDIVEIIEILEAAGCQELALLQCTTSYPTPSEQVNLAAMDNLKNLFSGPVGYSDHTEDGLAILAAVARGAKIVERHITILKDIPNAQDWKVSSGPDDFPQLVSDIRRVEKMIGLGDLRVQTSENGAIKWALKSLVVNANLPAGHTLTSKDIDVKRPGGGISPNRINDVLKTKLIKSMTKDQALSWKDILR